MIKKIILCFCLLLPNSLFALESQSHDVVVGNVEGSEEVVALKVDWDDLRFIYYYETNYIWNSETHKYETTTKEYWSDKNNIKISNESNKSIKVTPKYFGSIDGIKGSFSNNNFIINSRSNKSLSLTLSGFLPRSYKTFTKAGVLTLQIE